jgi:hypothetical protein
MALCNISDFNVVYTGNCGVVVEGKSNAIALKLSADSTYE